MSMERKILLKKLIEARDKADQTLDPEDIKIRNELEDKWANLAPPNIPTTEYVPPKYDQLIQRINISPATQQPKRNQLVQVPYKCKKCGQEFQFFHELGIHRRREEAAERKRTRARAQLTQVPSEVCPVTKILKVQLVGKGRRIATTFFLPKEWKYVLVHAPLQTDVGTWVLFEPVEP